MIQEPCQRSDEGSLGYWMPRFVGIRPERKSVGNKSLGNKSLGNNSLGTKSLGSHLATNPASVISDLLSASSSSRNRSMSLPVRKIGFSACFSM